MVYRVAIERCWFRLLDAARRRIAESYIIAGSRFARRDAPPAGRHVNLYVCGTGQWRVSYIRARCQYINWMICRPADPPFETVRLRDALSRRVKVNAGGGRPSQRVLKRPGGPVPTPWWSSLTIIHTSPSPRVPNHTLAHIHTHERTAQAIVSGEGQFAVRTRARSHALRLTAREQTPDRPTWQWWYPSSSGRGPSASPASEAMCDNAAPLPSRRERSSTGWPIFVRRKPWPLAQQAVTQLASSSKRARFRTYTLRRGRR